MSRGDPPELALVGRIPAFAKTPDTVLRQMIRSSPSRQFAAGEVLMHQAEKSEFAIILLSGEVSIVNDSQHGQAPLAVLAAPALVGEIGAISHLPRTASVLATTPARALLVARATLLDACRDSPEILVSVIRQLGRQIESVNHALGLYAGGLSALERGDLDPSILADLTNPSAEMRTFADAFQRLAQRIALERRKRDEMASAALIQRAMLPQDVASLPLHGRCDVFGEMQAARDVGGDFYDIFMLDGDRLALAIGDVCGKGVPASLFMSQTMTTLRMAAKQQTTVAAILESANAMLCAHNPSMMFATAFCGVLDLGSGRLEYANCGQSPPLLLRVGGACDPLPGRGAPLGLAPGKRVDAQETVLKPGEGLFLFTDGVTESIDPAGAEYGEERLAAVLSLPDAGGAAGLVACVMEDVAHFSAGAERFDDITCLAVVLS